MKKLESYEQSNSGTSDLPYGSFKNESSAGSQDGTEIKAEHMQDLYYALYQILQQAGVQPNGSLENGSTSKQFLSALGNIAPLLWAATSTYKKNRIAINVYNNVINVYQSLQDDNSATLSNTDYWKLIAKISAAGVFSNVTLNSPVLTGTPVAPTAAAGTNNTQIASTAFVKTAFKNFIKITSGFVSNGGTISPPSGFTMNDLAGFLPSIERVHYSGDVDGNDSTYCTYSINSSNITVTVYSSEQRAAARANYIAIWIKS
ncbi:MAG: hypothetical protein J5606_00140 [Bacteroidales bacterium]|nr:hypothetical protein [Bacteroidales bacterium]